MELAKSRPRLRPLEMKPVVHEGMPYLHLRDPLDLIGRDVFVPESFIPILPLLDGTRDITAIQFSLILRHNLRIGANRIQEMVQVLDEACFLENETYQSARQRAVEEYHAAGSRTSRMAGQSYQDDPESLEAYLAQFTPPVDKQPFTRDIIYRGVLSPHIDFERGGKVYAQTWNAVKESAQAAELVIIFGTDHYSEGFPISLTRQPYRTPYGLLPLPESLLDRLAEILGGDAAFAGELHHRSEHSVDLASVWLHHARAGEPVEMLPVLVGDLAPLSPAVLDDFVNCIRSQSRRRRTLVVAAGDLSHVGPAFGQAPVKDNQLARISATDQKILKLLDGGEPLAIHQALLNAAEQNICGAESITLTSRILGPSQAVPFDYAVCPADEAGTSFVTIAGLGLV